MRFAQWREWRSQLRGREALLVVHGLAWALIAHLAWGAWTGNLTVNPLQAAMQRSGFYALSYLVASLACTPLNTWWGWRSALRLRRPLGLYAYFFATLHVSLFVGLDYGFRWDLLSAEVAQKRYIIAGAAAFFLLTPLALTSFRVWMRRLGKAWKRLHRLVYIAAPVAVLHFAWARKGDIFRLQGDVLQPLAFALLVLILLVARLGVLLPWRPLGHHRGDRQASKQTTP